MKTLKSILPKGRFNGKTIDGFTVNFSVHLLEFYWLPKWGGEYCPAIFWLWFTVRWQAHYQ